MKAVLSAAVCLLLAAAPAKAAIIDTVFSGTVSTQQGTAFSVGQTIDGEFIYSTDASAFLFFRIDGVTIAPPFISTAGTTLDRFTALFQAAISAVQQGGPINEALTLDLEGINPFSSFDAISLLTDPSQVPGNLDPSSTFGFVIANADGTNIRQASATLASISTTVPEPASLTLLASVLGIGALARRRR